MAGWNDIVTGYGNVQENALNVIMDNIIKSTGFRDSYKVAMLQSSAMQVLRNQKLGASRQISSKAVVGNLVADASSLGGLLFGTMGLIDISVITNTAVSTALAMIKTSPELQDIWEKTQVEPNIEGIPISVTNFETDRQIEVGEQMMIVQSTAQKRYWTDNAVPKLKTWEMQGYISSALSIDAAYLIRPSLKMQIDFLDKCAESRRPVLFKDNRGVFRFVQIMNLRTTEEATYNNAIQIHVSLKEYVPYEVNNKTVSITPTSTNPDDVGVTDILKNIEGISLL